MRFTSALQIHSCQRNYYEKKNYGKISERQQDIQSLSPTVGTQLEMKQTAAARWKKYFEELLDSSNNGSEDTFLNQNSNNRERFKETNILSSYVQQW